MSLGPVPFSRPRPVFSSSDLARELGYADGSGVHQVARRLEAAAAHDRTLQNQWSGCERRWCTMYGVDPEARGLVSIFEFRISDFSV
jgi:hypothetical protein